MAEREVIREFLAKLGFTVDEPSFRKFAARLATSNNIALKTGSSILGIATATEAAVLAFSSGMEKMYYASRRTGSTITSLSALSYGFGQIGLQAEDAQGAIEAMSAATRNNPGLDAMLSKFAGSEKDPVLRWRALMKELKKMPYFIGSQFAEMFGTPEKVFRTVTLPGALEALEAAENKQKEMYRNMGVDQEKAGAASKDFMNTLRELWMEVGIVGDSFLIQAQGPLNEFHKVISSTLRDLAGVNFSTLEFSLKSLGGFVQDQTKDWGLWGKAIGTVATAAAALPEFLSTWMTKSNETLGAIYAYIVGGPNYENGGRREPLFPNQPGTEGEPPRNQVRRGWAPSEQDAVNAINAGRGTPFSYEIPGAGGAKPPAAPASPSGAYNPTLLQEKKKLSENDRLQILLNELNDPNRDPMWDDELRKEIGRYKNLGRGGSAPVGSAGAPDKVSSAGNVIKVEQNTTITVHGSEPEATAKAVERAQTKVNRDYADVLRNTTGALA